VKLPRRAAQLAPFLVLIAALALAHVEIFRAGAAEFAPLAREGTEISIRAISVADVTFEAWLVARHARTLWTHPWDLLDTEHCAPERHTITYGVPMIALGVLGMPAALFSREPVFIYNAALVAWSSVAALCMYVLVHGWTGRRAAGLAAALLFAFHPIRLANVIHPAEWDIAWTALALFFAERLFARGRWRDAIGLGAAGAMQVAASFYTLVAASLLALPLGLWLLLRRAPRLATLAQLAVAVAIVAIAAAIVLGPYLAARHEDRILERTFVAYAEWKYYAPGAVLYLGVPLMLGALAGLLAPQRLALTRVAGEPRPALLAGALLVAFVAAGPDTAAVLQGLHLPVPAFDPWAALARVVPGLDTVRGVGRLGTAVHLVACVLAGAGLAAAIALAGRYGHAVSAAGVAVAIFACFGFPWPAPLGWQLEPVRPAQATIDFFTSLEERGNTGPMLELPIDFGADDWTYPGPRRILLSFWHGRRTSACFGSFFRPPTRDEVVVHASALPAQAAIDALREMGFTTLVMHHEIPQMKAMTERKYARAIGREGGLRLVYQSEFASAWEILPAPVAGAGER